MPEDGLLSTELLSTIRSYLYEYDQGSLSSPETLLKMLSLLQNNETDIFDEYQALQESLLKDAVW